MLYLRTGSNGSCKTLFTLWDVRELQKSSGREVYFVKDRFQPEPILTDEFGWVAFEFKDWQKLPDGAIILADECHKDLPKRAPSAALPPHVQALAEHRARGFDFFLLTQHPMNIDEFVRRLIGAPGWHQHLKRVFGGTNVTRVIQWDAVNPQCEKNGSGKSGSVTTRQQPREVFKWYRSATLHTAKVKIPKQFFVLLACLLLVPVLGYMAYQKVMPKGAEAKPKDETPAMVAGGPSGSSERKPVTAAEYVAAYTPRVAGLMHTAPAYDKLTEPKRVPVPAACVAMPSKGCKCFTQDATPYPTPESVCRDFVAHGAFLAFQPEGDKEQRRRDEQPQRQVRADPGDAPPSGLAVISHQPGPLKDLGEGARIATGGAQTAQPRVAPGSKWSFSTAQGM